MATWQYLLMLATVLTVHFSDLTAAGYVNETITLDFPTKQPCAKADPPRIPNAHTIRVNSSVLYVSCLPTYVMVTPQSSQFLHCLPSGQAWQNYTGSCVKIDTDCGDIPPVPHGTVKLWISPFGYGHAFNVTCDPGYVITPPRASTWLECLSNRWQFEGWCGRKKLL